MRPRPLVASLAAIPLAIPLILWSWVLLRPGPLPNTRVRVLGAEGVELRLPSYGDRQRWAEDQARLLGQRPLTLHAGFHVWRVSYARLGARFEPETLLRDAAAIGRSGNPLVALRAAGSALWGEGNAVTWTPRVEDSDLLHGYVKEVAERVFRPAVPGTYDADGNAIEGIPSEELNLDLTLAAIETALRRGDGTARVRTQVVMPPLERRKLESFRDPRTEANVLMLERVTRYNPHNRGRARNIELAAQNLDGTILMPGARLSFNRIVGKRSAANGFMPAAEVRNGRLVDPNEEPCPSCIGGGVCQVAGTLHAVAFFSGLEVLEHHPHTRLSSRCYLPPGLDTAVAWALHESDVQNSKDFIIRNSYPFPVVVEALADQGQLRVRLRGYTRPYEVECCYDVSRRPDADGDEPGAVITRRRTVYKPLSRPIERRRISYPDSGTCMRSPEDIICDRCAG